MHYPVRSCKKTSKNLVSFVWQINQGMWKAESEHANDVNDADNFYVWATLSQYLRTGELGSM